MTLHSKLRSRFGDLLSDPVCTCMLPVTPCKAQGPETGIVEVQLLDGQTGEMLQRVAVDPVG